MYPLFLQCFVLVMKFVFSSCLFFLCYFHFCAFFVFARSVIPNTASSFFCKNSTNIGDALLFPYRTPCHHVPVRSPGFRDFSACLFPHLNGQVSQEGMGVGIASGCNRYRAPYRWLLLISPHFPPSTHNCLRWRRHGSELQEEDNISPWKYISIDSCFIRVVLEYRGPLLSADSFSVFQFV
jgi:hypothetical protein